MSITNKFCPDHPNFNPVILSSGNTAHVACARCPACNFFLGWVGKKKLAAHIDELENEAERLRSLVKLSHIRCRLRFDEMDCNLDESSLDWIWQHLLNQMLPATRDLFKPCGKLDFIGLDKATIAMKSSTMRTIAISKIPELTKIFSEGLGYSMAINLIVKPFSLE